MRANGVPGKMHGQKPLQQGRYWLDHRKQGNCTCGPSGQVPQQHRRARSPSHQTRHQNHAQCQIFSSGRQSPDRDRTYAHNSRVSKMSFTATGTQASGPPSARAEPVSASASRVQTKARSSLSASAMRCSAKSANSSASTLPAQTCAAASGTLGQWSLFIFVAVNGWFVRRSGPKWCPRPPPRPA